MRKLGNGSGQEVREGQKNENSASDVPVVNMLEKRIICVNPQISLA